MIRSTHLLQDRRHIDLVHPNGHDFVAQKGAITLNKLGVMAVVDGKPPQGLDRPTGVGRLTTSS